MALAGIAIRLLLALAIAAGLTAAGLLPGVTLAAPILAGSSLGVVLSVLKERRLQGTSYGQALIVGAGVADFATVLIITLLFSTNNHSSAGARATLVGLMVLLAVALFLGVRFATKLAAFGRLIERQAGATAQIRIRASFALLLGFTAVADRLGLELILGSFLAGAIVAALAVHREHPLYVVKLDAVGYGFFIPIFFIVTGANLNILTLIANHKSLALVPLLFVAMLIVKTVPAALYRVRYPARDAAAAGVLQTAQLMLPVAAVQIGKQLGILSDAVGAAVILASFFTMLLAPIGFSILGPRGTAQPSADEQQIGPPVRAAEPAPVA
jgi:Kef-type K+ transport system membrane component KefB